MDCSNCGSESATTQGVYQFRESGLNNVTLTGIELLTCKECGNTDPVIPNVNDLMAALAWHIATRKYRLNGEEVRFLRKYLKMSATEFAKLIATDRSTLSNWENGKQKIGPQSERLIRSVVLALGDGLKERTEEGVQSFEWLVDEYRPEQMRVDMDTMEVQTI
ncbi:Helix-turn-helix domain-containing protein [Bryocella elongata]|uniref:Helix-turn-helix domain-containing protein n=1 Tax=Bryocella elongata TaxID=863522 RepID=A0A1H5WK43_9BACT|nr:helix-turn-helix domain-containing protein [Bryocella elongata]SEF99277.1 Helix-turn-helix domain-containing protein [Bryocella elongata]